MVKTTTKPTGFKVGQKVTCYNLGLLPPLGPSIDDVTHLGGRGDLPKGDITPQAYLSYKSILIKVSDKGEGGVKSLKKWVTSFMDGPNK